MKFFTILLLSIGFLSLVSTNVLSEEKKVTEDMINNPVRYIEVHDWGFYVAARVAILHHVTIENKSSVAYTDIRIRVNYYSASPSLHGYKVGFQEKVLRITLPPGSKKTYLSEGLPIGAGSSQLIAKNLEILSARAVR